MVDLTGLSNWLNLSPGVRAGRPVRADGQPGRADEAAQRHHQLRLLTFDPDQPAPL